MQLVFLLEAAQDRDGVLDRRLGDDTPAGTAAPARRPSRRASVFVERRRADAMQLAARQRRLSRLEASIAPSALPAPTSVCISSMKRMMPPSAAVTSLSTAFRRSSNSPRYLAPAISAPRSSASSFLSCRLSGTSPLTMRSAKPFDDGGLADAGLADQHGIVLGAPRQHLDGAADFLVAADHRIELAVARRLGEVAGIFLERVIGVLGRGRIGGAALAQRLDGGVEVLRRDAGLGEDLAGLAVLLDRERQQQPLDGDEAVAGLLGGLLGGVEHARQRRLEIELAGAAALHLRQLGKRRLDGRQRVARVPPARSIRPAPSPPGRPAAP